MAVEAPNREAQLPADAAGLSEDFPLSMAPVTAIGGLLSVKAQWGFYRPLLAGGPDSGLSAQQRFSAIPEKGLGDFDEMYARLEERFLGIQQQLGERTAVVAQSLGSIFATKLGLDHPDKISSVASLAGLPGGINGETVIARALKRGLGNPRGAEKLQASSSFMQEHVERIASEWSPDTSLHLIAPTTDVLVPIAQSLMLELPEGQQAEKRVVVPHGVPSIVMRRVFGMPHDAQPLRSIISADHVSVAVTPAVIRHVRNIRRQRVDTSPLYVSEVLAAAA